MSVRFDLVSIGGEVLPAERGRIDPRDPAVTSGSALIETFAIEDGAPVWFDDHVARLHESETALGWPRTDRDELRERCMHLLAASGVRAGGLRVLRSPGPPGSSGTWLLDLRPLPEVPKDGVRLVVIDEPWAAPPFFDRHKHAGRLARRVLRERARAAGAWDALLVDGAGRLLETTCANVVVVDRDGRARTPPADRGVLPGIARGRLVACGLVEEGELVVGDLTTAREVLATNSLVRCVGACSVTGPTPGPDASPRGGAVGRTYPLPGSDGAAVRRLAAALAAEGGSAGGGAERV